MQYVLTNTLSIVHSTRVNNTVHTYTVYVTGMRKPCLCMYTKYTYVRIYVRILILQYVSPLLFKILEIYKPYEIPYKKLHK